MGTPESSSGDWEFEQSESLDPIIWAWQQTWFIHYSSGTICDGFVDYLKQFERTADLLERVEHLFHHCMIVRFTEAISRWFLQKLPEDIPSILSWSTTVTFPNNTPMFYNLFIEQMKIYYGQFLQWKWA